MPATISALPSIAFSKNPINVEIVSNDYNESDGIAAVSYIFFQGNVLAGNQVALTWSAASLIMEAVVAPDAYGNQFPEGDGSLAYVRSLIPIFQANYYIDRDFTIVATVLTKPGTLNDYACLILTARDAVNGALFNIAATSFESIELYPATLGVNRVTKANFAHHLEIWLNAGVGFDKIYDQNLQLDYPITGVTSKDISEILNPYVQAYSDAPSLTVNIWKQCVNTLLPYYVKFAQYFGDQPLVKKTTASPIAFVNIGGLSVSAALSQTLSGFLRPGGVNSKTLCLRQGSLLKTVQTDQPEWLYWLNLTGADVSILMKIDLYFTDKTTTAFLSAPQFAAAGQKYNIAVGYNQLNIPGRLPAGKTIGYYTATVVSAAGDQLSVPYSYLPVAPREYARYFVFLNSLGGYQTLFTYGKAQDSSDRSKTDIRRQVTYSQAAESGSLYEANIRLQDKTLVNTGYNYRREIELIKDFFASTEKYFVNKGRLVPIGITTQTLTQPLDGSFLNAGQFEFYPLYDSEVFTDDTDQPDYPNNSGAVLDEYRIHSSISANDYDTIFIGNI